MAVISNSSPQAAGQLDKHYSPITPILLGNLPQLIEANQYKKLGILSFSQAYHIPNSINFVLSNKGSTDEAATNLFAALRYLDECKPDLIVAELVPNTGLGLAINDRLKRAASK
jgi:L-threonylcarbamoyladenylate synthase